MEVVLCRVLQKHLFANREQTQTNGEQGQVQGQGQGKALPSPSTTPTDSNATKNVIHFGKISNTDHSDEMDVMDNSKAVMQSVSRTIQSGAHAHEHETETETHRETHAYAHTGND